ncbi:hypothetical protein BIW11_05390 [Tropilaelaps mercedesae]|uniref:BACK domain-containing protein n=1 Tax=Tropilaelaps mercedesae TaxID=418985 RepID=A0A1V9Y2G5_9ACAR|nr:hypothetical protein BIW11_05390 [Tropilaelaps mercedesae]
MGGSASKRGYKVLSLSESDIRADCVEPETWCAVLFEHRLYTASPGLLRVTGPSRFEVEEMRPKALQQLGKRRRNAKFAGNSVELRGADGSVTAHSKVLRSACWHFVDDDLKSPRSFHDLTEFTRQDIANLLDFIYENSLPTDIEQLFNLNRLAEHIRYNVLAAKTAERLVLVFETDQTVRSDQAMSELVNWIKLYRLPVLYKRLCVSLCRFTHDLTILLRLCPATLCDVLLQDGLAVDNEDQVAAIVAEFYRRNPHHRSMDVASCVRYNLLSESVRHWFPFQSGIVWSPRHAYEGHEVRISLRVRRAGRVFVCSLLVDHVLPDKTQRELYTVEESSWCDAASILKAFPGKDRPVKADEADEYRLRVQILSLPGRRTLLTRLGPTAVEVDLCNGACRILTRDATSCDHLFDGILQTARRRGHTDTHSWAAAGIGLSGLLATPRDRLVVKFYHDDCHTTGSMATTSSSSNNESMLFRVENFHDICDQE